MIRLGPPSVRKIDASVVRKLGARAVRKLSECSCWRRLGAPAVQRLGPPAVRKIDASAVRRLGARDEVGGRAFNDEKVVIINNDKFICVSVCC